MVHLYYSLYWYVIFFVDQVCYIVWFYHTCLSIIQLMDFFFRFFAIINNSAINILDQFFFVYLFGHRLSVPFGIHSQVKSLGHLVSLKIMGNLCTIFQRMVPFYFPPTVYKASDFFSPHQRLLLCAFVFIAILVSYHLFVGLIFTFLMTQDIEHVFCFLVISVSSLEKFLFKSMSKLNNSVLFLLSCKFLYILDISPLYFLPLCRSFFALYWWYSMKHKSF